MKKNIILHLGIHKTATTYLQHVLQKNSTLLDLSDIKVYTPHTLRKSKYCRLLRLSLSGKAAAEKFAKLNQTLFETPPSKTIIFSEENSIGRSGDFKKCGRLYPYADRLLGRLSRHIQGHNVKILVCLRSLSTFLPSLYCEHLRHSRKYISFESFYSNLNPHKVSWFNFIKRIQKKFPNDEIVVWDFSLLKNNDGLARILNEFLPGVDLSTISVDHDVMRPGMTKQCIKILQNLHAELSTTEYKQLKRFLDRGMRWDVNDKFQPFSESEIVLLEQEHRFNLTKISNIKNNVRMLL